MSELLEKSTIDIVSRSAERFHPNVKLSTKLKREKY